MSDLGLNKIAAGVLSAALAIFFMNQISDHLFESTSVTPAKMGYHVEPPPPGGDAPAVVMPSPDWGTVLPAADLKAGEQIFVKCASCHKPTDENGTGPGLLGVLGRAPGSHPGFKYSDAMTAFGAATPKWDFDHVEKFITKPQAYINGTKMTFPGLKQQQDRINVIAYLHSLSPGLAVPAPDAARAAATAAALAPKVPGAPAAPAAPAGAPPAAGAAPAAGAVGPTAAGATPAVPVKK